MIKRPLHLAYYGLLFQNEYLNIGVLFIRFKANMNVICDFKNKMKGCPFHKVLVHSHFFLFSWIVEGPTNSLSYKSLWAYVR